MSLSKPLSYGSRDLPKLRNELRSRGARLSGRKNELIERLEAYDRNKDFGREELEPEFCMSVPSLEHYKDINIDTDFTDLTLDAVESYLLVMQKTIDSDAKFLYTNRFLKYLRLASDTDKFYVKSECRAQMKKSVSYVVDVCIDKNGCVLEGQCECAAGMGPKAHCKHICAVLFACFKFSTCKELVTEETCTQKLQSFHKTKPYYGSPIKACNLPLAKESTMCVNFDPRPLHFRNLSGYSDHFRSVWMNHDRVNEYPVSQLFTPANPYALDTDHDYLELPSSDIWLQEMKITKITVDEINEVEQHTRGQATNKSWFLERCIRIHSSNFGRICKATPRTNMLNLARNLTQYSNTSHSNNDKETSSSPAPIHHGKTYEAVALNQFEEITGLQTQKCGSFISLSNPYLASSPDALLGDDELVEVKCPYSAKDSEVTPDTVPYLNIVNGELTLDHSHSYFYQIQGQLFCTGRKECKLVVYTFKDLKIISVPRDETFIDDMIMELVVFFKLNFKHAVLERFFFKDYNRYSFQD